MKIDSKLITVALIDFALPVPRIGSIEAFSGSGRATALGQKIHAHVQRMRQRSEPSYDAEVRISRIFDWNGRRFQIDGRMDGIFREEIPRIEEIKTGFNIRDLAHRLSEDPMTHPYCLQLQTYGYLYWLEYKVIPKLTLHLVSSRNADYLDLEQHLDMPVYEKWLGLRLSELAMEVTNSERRIARRKKIAEVLTFPFKDPRPGQSEIMQTLEQWMQERQPMLIQAPTGLGKTVGILYPVIKEAMSRGQKVVYVTPKNSQHAVAEEAVMRFQDTGAKIKSLTITAKNKICFKNDQLCSPELCEYARDYYSKVHENHLLEMIARKKRLNIFVFKRLGEAFKVCPYELQLEGADEADIVICDYNYVFAQRSIFERMSHVCFDQVGRPNLIIDEAHNLPARAMDHYSFSLSNATLRQMRAEIQRVSPFFQRDAEELFDDCIQVITTCQTGNTSRPKKIDPPIQAFTEQDAKLRAFLSRYLDSNAEIQPHDIILRFCLYWSDFTEALVFAGYPKRSEFFTTFHPDEAGGVIKLTCCDASAMLKDCYNEYEHVVGFSATLKPFEYYAMLSGLDPGKVNKAEFQSPFPKKHRKFLIIPQISTKYTDRERNYPRIADVIHKIAAVKRGNYLVFFPSFEFLERVLGVFDPPVDFMVISQERNMQSSRIEALLDHLRSERNPTIMFAVQGGSFAEGVDYPGKMAIGAFIIGPPLPNFDLEREYMREYYQKRYGAGFDYAYTIPAMAKAIQAAGRVIRSETDRGLIVLVDNRFTQARYTSTMPFYWFKSHAYELVSHSILKEVSDFWQEASIKSRNKLKDKFTTRGKGL